METAMPALSDRLHPKRFPGMSGRMAAVVGFILGERWSKPRIAELVPASARSRKNKKSIPSLKGIDP
jgi:hypothetical protein